MSPSNSTSSSTAGGFPLEALSWIITRNASVVSQYLAGHDLPQPSFDSDGTDTVVPKSAPQYIREARQNLISASLEMLQLAIGPSEFVPNLALGFQYVSCVSWLCQYDIFRRVPLNGTISYDDLAAAAQVPKQRLTSIVRMAMTDGLFREQPDGRSVRHSATSGLLARNGDIHAWASYICSNSAPMALSLSNAQRRWGPDSVKKHETAYNLAFGTDLPFFDHLSRDEVKMQNFAAYMRNVRNSEGVDIKHLVSGFAWDGLNDQAVVVDVGGSMGSAALALAKSFQQLKFVVQDLPANADAGRTILQQQQPANEDLLSRISFQAHDFNQPQPVHGADVYLLRMILHDWPDAEARTILAQIVAAMRPSECSNEQQQKTGKEQAFGEEQPWTPSSSSSRSGSRLLIMDTVLPDPGSVPLSVERIVRVRDLTMLQAFNSKERDLADWTALLASVDERLRLVNVVRPYASDMSVLEVELMGS